MIPLFLDRNTTFWITSEKCGLMAFVSTQKAMELIPHFMNLGGNFLESYFPYKSLAAPIKNVVSEALEYNYRESVSPYCLPNSDAFSFIFLISLHSLSRSP